MEHGRRMTHLNGSQQRNPRVPQPLTEHGPAPVDVDDLAAAAGREVEATPAGRTLIRSYDESAKKHILSSVERIVRSEAKASGAPATPTIESIESFPVVVNDKDALGRTLGVFAEWLGADKVMDPGAGAGSEDVGILATSSNAPLSYWLLGGTDHRRGLCGVIGAGACNA